ncbi:MAG: Ig-like domain-containing protein [Mycobacteriaceae bacterium]
MGINQLDFISPRVFGPLDNINDGEHCHFRPQKTMSSSITVGATPNSGVGVAGTVLFAMVNPGDAGGTVSFTDEGNSVPDCDARPITSGFATCVTTFATAGRHTISADYSGDSTHDVGTASTPISVTSTPDVFQIVWGLLIAYAHNLHLWGL